MRGVRARRGRRWPDRLPEGSTLLDVRELVVERGGRPLLAGVSVRVGPGEIVAVVGPNGAGKSTLLRALSGDHQAAAGAVVLAGGDLSTYPAVDLARIRGVLPQQVAVAFPFTVDEVVRMGRAPWVGISSYEDDESAVAWALTECDVAHLAHRPYPELSGGEQARVSLARVLVQQTQLLLLDEPTAALDLRHQEQVFAILRGRAEHGDAVVVVLHDLTAAAAHADRIILLDRGVIVADGPPEQTLEPDRLARVYQHEVEVFPNPRTGALTVVSQRLPPRSPQPMAAMAGPTGES